MKPRYVSQNVHRFLEVLILVFSLCLTFSFFFPSIMVLSKGIDKIPSPITLFEYLNYTSPWLILSFCFAILTIFICVSLMLITMMEMFGIIPRKKLKEIISLVVIITSILAFVFTIVYCVQNTSYSSNTDDVYLKFAPGVSMYFVLVGGFASGICGLLDSPTFTK